MQWETISNTKNTFGYDLQVKFHIKHPLLLNVGFEIVSHCKLSEIEWNWDEIASFNFTQFHSFHSILRFKKINIAYKLDFEIFSSKF